MSNYETFFWPFSRFWELIIGSILAWFTIYKPYIFLISLPKLFEKYHKLDLLFLALNKIGIATFTGLFLIVVSVFLIDESTPFPSYIAFIPALGAALIIIGGSANYLAKFFLCNRLSIWFGLISYPLYLWHWPILSYFYIVEDGTPHRDKRILAVVLSIIFAWITYRFVEKPIRFGKSNKSFRSIALAIISFLVGLVGFWISNLDLKEIKGVDDIYLRKGLKHRIGSTSRWYEGLNDWLFLGNYYDETVAKLLLSEKPSNESVSNEVARFNELAESGRKADTNVALLIGPNKSSVYPEYLPVEINPSSTRYISYYTDRLGEIDDLYLLDPTELLIRAKEDEGLLYWRTDTHWNQKGAYLAFAAIMEELDLEYPRIQFSLEGEHRGDLITISNLNNFAIHADDNWIQNVLTDDKLDITPDWMQKDPSNMYGMDWKGTVENEHGLNELSVWVLGDSFTSFVKPYLNASFSNIKYLGHWNSNIDSLPSMLSRSTEKPDLVFIVRVERSF